MAAHIGKFAMTLGALLVSGQLFAHSHGHQMTEAEQKAANGVFEDKDVKDRALSDWDGTAVGLSVPARWFAGSGL